MHPGPRFDVVGTVAEHSPVSRSVLDEQPELVTNNNMIGGQWSK